MADYDLAAREAARGAAMLWNGAANRDMRHKTVQTQARLLASMIERS